MNDMINPVSQVQTPATVLQFRTDTSTDASSSRATSGNGSAVKVTISKQGIAQSLLISSSGKLDVFMEEIRSEKISRTASSVIGRKDAHNLFLSVTNLGEGQLNGLVALLEDPSINKTDLLSALATAGDSAGDMMGVISRLDPEERDDFLALAARAGSDGASDLVKIAERMGNTDLHLDFLTLAKDLEEEDLANFIAAAADNPDSMAGLVSMTERLGETDRENFLKAAADSPNLRLLISHTRNMDMDSRSDFIWAAARSGQALEDLVGLSTRLSGKDFQRDILPMALVLSQDEFENYLGASINSGGETEALQELTSSLAGKQRSSFLKAAARAGQKTGELVHQVSGFGGNSTDLDNFLAAASRTKEMGAVLSLTRQAGDKQSSFLDLAGNLSAPDLQNFLDGAGQMQSSTLMDFIDQAGELSGIEQSHFLFGASKVGSHQDDYLHLVGKLAGEERAGVLLVIANGNSQETPSIINRIHNMDAGDQRAGFIADAMLAVILTEDKPMASAYVHLTNFLDSDEYNDFLTAVAAPGNADEADRLLAALETVSDRSSFLAAAADAKSELSPLLDLGEKTSDETRESLMKIVGNLRGENLQNFLKVAVDSNEKNLDEFLKLTDQLKGQERENFLKASVDAGEQGVLGKFMGLTNCLTAHNRSLFLAVVETAGHLLGNLVQATHNYMASQEKSFMIQGEAAGFDLTKMIAHEDPEDPAKVTSIGGVSSGYLFNYLENADASKQFLGRYLTSYLS